MNGPDTQVHPVVAEVTDRIVERSRERRTAYLSRVEQAAQRGPARGRLACANLAHGFAAADAADKDALRQSVKPNVAIVSAYNDMLSAHQPFEAYPARLKRAVQRAGGIAQFAGGVPAMCDGVTQGRDGMELSLFSRDVIAMAAGIALAHDMFDAVLMLGVCDKIVPGLLVGALSFGHLPAVFVPAGPMTSGLANAEKSRIRQEYAEGKVTREALLDAEAASYHGRALTWDDLSDLSAVVPLLARIYPNGKADVNHFHAAGGLAFAVRELLDAGLLHEDVRTVAGPGLRRYTEEPVLRDGELGWQPMTGPSLDPAVLRPCADPFSADGGLRMLDGNLGRAVMKVSAVKPEHRAVTAPAHVFDDQADFLAAFSAGRLDSDLVAVMRYQGPQANGMPELHKLTPALGVLQDRGHRVALVTDGRMSGASGKVPAAIHLTPEAAAGGPLARVREGDLVTVDAESGEVRVHVADGDLADRQTTGSAPSAWVGTGRELFASLRASAGPADRGASVVPAVPAQVNQMDEPMRRSA
jgi:dihydroxyacid dehydratase/phosphogluconate dehydratase